MRKPATLLILSILVGPITILASDDGPPSQLDLVLSLEAVKPTFVLYEPVVVTYMLKNPTDSLITSRLLRIDYGAGALRLFIQYEEEEPVPLKSMSSSSSRRSTSDLMRHLPGEAMVAAVPILYNYGTRADVLAFAKTGRYSVSAKISLGEAQDSPESGEDSLSVEGLPIEIEVVEPREQDQGLIDYLGSEQILLELIQGRFASFCADETSPSCFEELRSLIEVHQSSAYAPYIAYSVASNVGEDQGLRVSPRPLIAAELFEEFLNKWPDHPMKYFILTRLPFKLSEAGREKEAATWIERYKSEFPGNRSMIQAMQMRIQGEPAQDQPQPDCTGGESL